MSTEIAYVVAGFFPETNTYKYVSKSSTHELSLSLVHAKKWTTREKANPRVNIQQDAFDYDIQQGRRDTRVIWGVKEITLSI